MIPCYRHGATLHENWCRFRRLGYPIILVDDGGTSEDASYLRELENDPMVTLLRHETNRGKGAAVVTGVVKAAEMGFTHILQIDADCQHLVEDIPRFISVARANPERLVLGSPVFGRDAPPERVYCRQLCNLLIWLQTGSFAAKDGMFGFRVYPVLSLLTLENQRSFSRRMGFDVEAVIRLMQSGVKVISLPTPVQYPASGVSNYRYWHDNRELVCTHARLIFSRIWEFLFGKRPCRRSEVWHTKRERGTLWGLRCLFLIGRFCGKRVVKGLLPPVVRYFMLVDPVARRASEDYLARIAEKKQCPELSSYEHLCTFANSIVDWTFSWYSAGKAVRVPEPPIELRALEERLVNGRGGIILSAHFGQLEWLRSYLLAARKQGLVSQSMSILAMMHHGNSGRFRTFLELVNPATKEDIIQVNSITPASLNDMRKAIDEGRWIAILADRTPLSGPRRTLSSPFLGGVIDVPMGPFLIAYLLKADVLTLFCYKKNGRHQYRFCELECRFDLPRAQVLRSLVERYVGELEQVCLEAPLEWFNFFDMFVRNPESSEPGCIVAS